MSALLTLTIGRAFFGGLVLGFGVAVFFGRWSVARVCRHLRHVFSRRVADMVHAFAEAVEEPTEEKRRELFFDAVQAAYNAHKREDELRP